MQKNHSAESFETNFVAPLLSAIYDLANSAFVRRDYNSVRYLLSEARRMERLARSFDRRGIFRDATR